MVEYYCRKYADSKPEELPSYLISGDVLNCWEYSGDEDAREAVTRGNSMFLRGLSQARLQRGRIARQRACRGAGARRGPVWSGLHSDSLTATSLTSAVAQMKRCVVLIVVDLSKVSCPLRLADVPRCNRDVLLESKSWTISRTELTSPLHCPPPQPSEVLPAVDFWLSRTRERCKGVIDSMTGTRNEKVAQQLLVSDTTSDMLCRRCRSNNSPSRHLLAYVCSLRSIEPLQQMLHAYEPQGRSPLTTSLVAFRSCAVHASDTES